MKLNAKKWIIGYLMLVLIPLAVAGIWVIHVDPFFHYHKPYTSGYYYALNNQRSQNDGILKHFDYNAVITGTSMTENFKTSELDALFGTNSVKVPYSGGSYKEINDSLKSALANNQELKTIIRGLDMSRFMIDKDNMRFDLGEYPVYLYDDNPFNDVKYIFNRDVLFTRVWPMVTENDKEDFKPGITSFDAYSNWMASYTFGVKTVCPEGVAVQDAGNPVHLTDEEKKTVLDTARQNITSLAAEYPEVTFYYFFTPYSTAWWKDLAADGTIYKQIEAEELIIKEILQYSNIKLYSFNTLTNITADLNHYKDVSHYGSWVNSLMLKYMKDDKCLLTADNYEQYLAEELDFYTSYDYSQINGQEDYEYDYYAEALLNQEIRGIVPLHIPEDLADHMELNNAEIVSDQHGGTAGIACTGHLQRKSQSGIPVEEYLISSEFVGARIIIDDITDYRLLKFYGMKNRDHGQPGVYIYDEQNAVVAKFAAWYPELDNEWHQYMIDISKLSGKVTLIFNGGYTDNTGAEESLYTFSNIVLY